MSGFTSGPGVKNPPANGGNTGSTAGSGKSHLLQSSWAHEAHPTTEPARLKPPLCNKSPSQGEDCAPLLERSPCSLQLETAHAKQWGLGTAKNKNN